MSVLAAFLFTAFGVLVPENKSLLHSRLATPTMVFCLLICSFRFRPAQNEQRINVSKKSNTRTQQYHSPQTAVSRVVYLHFLSLSLALSHYLYSLLLFFVSFSFLSLLIESVYAVGFLNFFTLLFLFS